VFFVRDRNDAKPNAAGAYHPYVRRQKKERKIKGTKQLIKGPFEAIKENRRTEKTLHPTLSTKHRRYDHLILGRKRRGTMKRLELVKTKWGGRGVLEEVIGRVGVRRTKWRLGCARPVTVWFGVRGVLKERRIMG